MLRENKILVGLTAASLTLIAVRATVVSIVGSPLPTHFSCLRPSPILAWILIFSHGIVWIAYSIIPFLLFKYALIGRRDQWPAMNTLLFVAFIFLCGLGHLVSVLTFFIPIYPTLAVVNALTAIVSIGTAGILPSVIRQVSSGLDFEEMKALIAELQAAKEDVAEAVLIAPQVEALARAQEKLDAVYSRCDSLAAQMAAFMGGNEGGTNNNFTASP